MNIIKNFAVMLSLFAIISIFADTHGTSREPSSVPSPGLSSGAESPAKKQGDNVSVTHAAQDLMVVGQRHALHQRGGQRYYWKSPSQVSYHSDSNGRESVWNVRALIAHEAESGQNLSQRPRWRD